MFPMMIPLRIRNQNDQDTLYAQQRYSPCRNTTLGPRGDAAEDDDGGRGPGSLALDELNTLAGNAERKRCSLYSSDRDVTPTALPAVDTIYNSEKLHALTNLVEKQGNTAITLQSPTPRFETPSSPGPHPGAYSPERFAGAFPTLLDKVTPQSVRLSKERARADFEETFAIRSVNSVTPSPTRGGATGRIQPLRSLTATAKTATPSNSRMEWTGLQSAPLKPASTPRNAYSDSANRQLVLSARR